jgi:hypothetical protein
MGAVEEQNRDLLKFLLAPHGGLSFIKDHLQDLPMWLDGGMIPVCIGQPPYHFREPPLKHGRLRENGTDVGLFLMAESIGAAHDLRQRLSTAAIPPIQKSTPAPR